MGQDIATLVRVGANLAFSYPLPFLYTMRLLNTRYKPQTHEIHC